MTAPNPIVAATYADSFQLQIGGYVVKERDAPLFQVRLNDAGGMEIRELPPGTTTTMTYIDLLQGSTLPSAGMSCRRPKGGQTLQ